MNSAAALALLSSLSLGADPLSDLRAALARLSAISPVAARFTVHSENVSGAGQDAVTVVGEVGGEVTEGSEGLQIRWSRAVVQRVRDEERRRAASPEEPAPTRDGLTQVQAVELANRLDAAGPLRDELSRATLVEARDDQLDGAPARLLVLKLSPVLSARDRRYLKELEAIGKIWLGPDGLPLAAEAQVHGRGRIFLVIGFETEVRQSWRFSRIGDRLVAVRHEDQRRWGGAGEHGERRIGWVLDLLPAPGRADP